MSRTPRGTGPLKRPRKGGSWFFYLDQRRTFTPYQNQADAEAWRQRHLAETAVRAEIARTENCTVGELLRIVEDDHASHNERSIASLRNRLKRIRAKLEEYVRGPCKREPHLEVLFQPFQREGALLELVRRCYSRRQGPAR